MATTTNYGWTTPDDTALVKDGASAIRSLGSSIDTTTKALNPSTTLGDIEYRSSTANTNTRLPIGTSGQVLTVSGGVPAWTTLSSGKLIQTVYASTTTATGSSSSTYADTTLTATITPTSASNNILVLVSQNGLSRNAASAAAGIAIRLFRNSTNIAQLLNEGAYTNSTLVQNIASASIMLLDSPATTSATTYKTQFANDGNAGTVTVQLGSARSTIILMEVAP